MKLSIIIPVYRVEDTLNRCIERVVIQVYPDMEIILVDDGSPDRCPEICDEWARKDSRIKVIHKQNSGLSDARNTGLDIAKGDYVTFVDSDDFIGDHTYAPLMERLSEHPDIDILEYPIYVFYESKQHYKWSFPLEKEYTDMYDYWYECQAYRHSYACNKIYRSELFKTIRYPVGILFEDMHTLPKLLKTVKKVATSNLGIYYYTANPKGITSTADGNALRMLLQPHIEIVNNSHREGRDFQTYYLHVLNIQMDVYERTGDAPVLKRRHLNPKYFKGIARLKAFMLNITDIKGLCKINKIVHKFKKVR